MTLSEMAEHGHEQVAYFRDGDADLRAIIAIHDTRLGPAVGGTRLYGYATEDDALEDALRLSRAMAYKTAAADLDFGGGKGVIVADPDEKTDDMLRAYGRAVDRLGGVFRTGEDMNIDVADVEVMEEETRYAGGSEEGTDLTAHGVLAGMRACLAERYGDDSLSGVEVVVQGCGKVGAHLVEGLAAGGADVTVADVDREAAERMAEEHGADVIDPEDVYGEPCDVFAPCAIGGVVDDETVPEFACDIVAGSANNVLAERRHAGMLADRGILYAPDYVINAGGLIAGVTTDPSVDVRGRVGRIRDRLERMIAFADREGITVAAAADRYAEARMRGEDVDGLR